MWISRTGRQSALSVLTATALGILIVGSTFAHARFIESDPAPDASVTAAPGWVTIWFGEILEYQGNSIKVTAPDGVQVDRGDVTLLDGNHRAMWVSLQPNLAPGAYQVTWSNVSAEDGHAASGDFWFTYAPDPLRDLETGDVETEGAAAEAG